jgi:hypothetical protein
MTTERAIEILNPEHREHYDSIETVNEACRMGMEALERTKWIPVTERLPEKRRMVLLHFGSGYELVGCLSNNYRGQNCWVARKINSPGLEIVVDPDYWMLLPEPPGVEP